MEDILPAEIIEKRIYVFRGKKVMFDYDLAKLYEVKTKRLNEAVQRNISRFPEEFAFQLTRKEYENLRSQIATSSWGESGFNKYPNYQGLHLSPRCS